MSSRASRFSIMTVASRSAIASNSATRACSHRARVVCWCTEMLQPVVTGARAYD